MKAAVLDSVDGYLHVEDIEIDSPQPREVLIRTGLPHHPYIHRIACRNAAGSHRLSIQVNTPSA